VRWPFGGAAAGDPRDRRLVRGSRGPGPSGPARAACAQPATRPSAHAGAQPSPACAALQAPTDPMKGPVAAHIKRQGARRHVFLLTCLLIPSALAPRHTVERCFWLARALRAPGGPWASGRSRCAAALFARSFL